MLFLFDRERKSEERERESEERESEERESCRETVVREREHLTGVVYRGKGRGDTDMDKLTSVVGWANYDRRMRQLVINGAYDPSIVNTARLRCSCFCLEK